MKYIFLGGVIPKSQKQKLHSACNGPVQPAAEAFQWNIISGFEQNTGQDLTIISTYFIGEYPKYCKNLHIKGFKWNANDHRSAYTIAFVNLKIVQHFLKYYNIIKFLKRNEIEFCKEPTTLIIYSAYFPFLGVAEFVKKKFSNFKICLIVTDLPEFMGLGSKGELYHKISGFFSKIIVGHSIKHIDFFVFLTEAMNERINKKNKPYLIIEGIIEKQNHKNPSNLDSYEKIIMYSGTLQKKYGIINLLEAFNYIPGDNYKLIICGDGEAKRDIIKASQIDNRIIYLGLIEREKVLELQSNSTLLVNPRQNNEEFTKYSFPSKILEYLQSGKPVLAYDLDGMPSEYKDYLIYIGDNSAQTLAKEIVRVTSMSKEERDEIGLKGMNFVQNMKNNIVQTTKILNMFTQR